MALSVYGLYEDASRMFGASALGGRFEKDFVSAVNYLLDELSFYADLTTDIPHINGPNEDIDELDESDYRILLTGLEWKLGDFGRTSSKNGVALYDRAYQQWERVRGDFHAKKVREDMEDEDDDENYETDIIGLGYLG